MSDAFEEYHRVRCADGSEKIVFMSWAAYWEPTLEKLTRGPMLRLEVYDADSDSLPSKVSPLNTGEAWSDHNDPEKKKTIMEEWVRYNFI